MTWVWNNYPNIKFPKIFVFLFGKTWCFLLRQAKLNNPSLVVTRAIGKTHGMFSVCLQWRDVYEKQLCSKSSVQRSEVRKKISQSKGIFIHCNFDLKQCRGHYILSQCLEQRRDTYETGSPQRGYHKFDVLAMRIGQKKVYHKEDNKEISFNSRNWDWRNPYYFRFVLQRFTKKNRRQKISSLIQRNQMDANFLVELGELEIESKERLARKLQDKRQ